MTNIKYPSQAPIQRNWSPYGQCICRWKDLGSGYQLKEQVIRTMILGLDTTLHVSCTALPGTHQMENILYHFYYCQGMLLVHDQWSHCLQNETPETIRQNKTSVLSCYVQVVGHNNEKPNTSVPWVPWTIFGDFNTFLQLC